VSQERGLHGVAGQWGCRLMSLVCCKHAVAAVLSPAMPHTFLCCIILHMRNLSSCITAPAPVPAAAAGCSKSFRTAGGCWWTLWWRGARHGSSATSCCRSCWRRAWAEGRRGASGLMPRCCACCSACWTAARGTCAGGWVGGWGGRGRAAS
jgi:hypothetical protein